MLTEEQKTKLKNAGYSDAKIKAFELRKFGTQSKPSFLEDAVGDIKETVSGVRSALSGASTGAQKASDATLKGEQSQVEGFGQFVGSGARSLSNALGEAVIGAGKAILPQSAEDAVGSTVEKATTAIAGTQPVQTVLNKYERLKQTNPRLARNLDALLGIGQLALDVAGGFAGSTTSKVVRRGVGEALDTATDLTTRGVKATGRAVGDIAEGSAEFTASQITGLNTDTLKTIFQSPDAFQKAQNEGLDRLALAQQVKDSIDTRIAELEGVGSQYDVVRNSGAEVRLSDNFIEEAIKAEGLDVVDGRVVATKGGRTRKPSEITALQNLYDNWADSDVLTANEFLNLRQDLSNLAKFDSSAVSKSKPLENISKKIRFELNKFRDQIDGLKELDAEFSTQTAPLQRLKKDFFDANGDLKDSAINRIANSAGKGKDLLLQRLKEIVPDIEERVMLVKALEDVNGSNGIKVGTYVRSGLGGGALLTGNIPAALLFFATASPKNVANFITWAGRKFPKYKDAVGSTIQKLQKGEKLDGKESEFVSFLTKQGQKTVNQFLDTVGAGTGVALTETIE